MVGEDSSVFNIHGRSSPTTLRKVPFDTTQHRHFSVRVDGVAVKFHGHVFYFSDDAKTKKHGQAAWIAAFPKNTLTLPSPPRISVRGT